MKLNFPKFSYEEKLLLILIVSSIFVRSFFIFPIFSDENFYFNVAKLVLKGEVPYKDFFFAHPPLQIYSLSLLFSLFGTSLFIGKFYIVLVSSLVVFLFFKILRRFLDLRKSLIGVLLFMISPVFISFSAISYGFWESLLFNLLAFYLVLKKKTTESALVFAISVFFRYVSIIYFPLILFFIKSQKLDVRRYLFLTLIFIFSVFLFFILIFGPNYFKDTVSFQIFSKILTDFGRRDVFQYWNVGFSYFFLGILAALYGYFQKNRNMLIFSIYPMAVDMLMFSLLTGLAYQYFLLSFPYLIISITLLFFRIKTKIFKSAIILAIAFSIMLNLNTFDFYLNPTHASKFYNIDKVVTSLAEKNSTIFGEPIMTSYVSFVSGIPVVTRYADSYIEHLTFENKTEVIRYLSEKKPKVFIDLLGYFISDPEFGRFLVSNYEPITNVGDSFRYDYTIYKVKSI